MTALAVPGAEQLELLGAAGELLDGSVCQRWDDRRPSWRRTSEGGFNPARYDVVEIGEADAKGFVVAHHYSGTYPAASLRFGMIDRLAGGRLVGVAVLGVPMSAKVLTGPFPGLEPFRQTLELSRLVLLDAVPAPAETWFLARAFRIAAGYGVRGVVMFSDPLPRWLGGRLILPGHVGIIYQALGCIYTGRGTPRTLTLLPDGTVLPARSMQKIRAGERGAAGVVDRLVELGATRSDMVIDEATWDELTPAEWLAMALREIGATQVRHQGNHRYVLPIGDRAQRRGVDVAFEALPFPKRPDPAPARPAPGLLTAA